LKLRGIELDSSAFDQISLHDVRVYALVFQRWETQGNLVLDIDYIAEWPCEKDADWSFVVAPATLTFSDVVDLQIHLDWGDKSIREKEPHGVVCCSPGGLIISDFTRSNCTDPLYGTGPKPYFRYELVFWVPQGARIHLGARDFKIVGRQPPVRTDQQPVEPAQRVPLVSGGN
jgi:hypothetical protein